MRWFIWGGSETLVIVYETNNTNREEILRMARGRCVCHIEKSWRILWGGARYSLSALSENHRSLMCNRLQMGATRTSESGKTDRMCERTTGVLILNSSGGGVAGTLDSSYYKGQGIRQGIEREFVVIYETDRNNSGSPYSEGNAR